MKINVIDDDTHEESLMKFFFYSSNLPDAKALINQSTARICIATLNGDVGIKLKTI